MVRLITPERKYIKSYWETVDIVAKEKKYLAMEKAFPYESTVQFVEQSLEKGLPQIFAVAEKQDICVGWCDAMEKEPGIGFMGMGLRPEYREQGIGKAMIREIIHRCRQFGYHTLTLDVKKGNERAVHVYEAVGFQLVTEVDGGYRLHGKEIGEAVLQMKLDLLPQG